MEDGIVVGNTFDKYGSKNPMVRWMVRNFCEAVDSLIAKTSPGTILEVGCGEGHITQRLLANSNGSIHALDISDHVIDQAKQRISSLPGKDRVVFENRNILDMEKGSYHADLVVCCEVLEHLEDPRGALQTLANSTAQHAILSVPREPLWRALNLARLSYITDLGNTPGHLQHWSQRSFVEFVSSKFDVVEVLSPIPWTFVLCKTR